MMAGQHGTVKEFYGLPKSLISKMRHVQNHVNGVHLPQEFVSFRRACVIRVCIVFSVCRHSSKMAGSNDRESNFQISLLASGDPFCILIRDSSREDGHDRPYLRASGA